MINLISRLAKHLELSYSYLHIHNTAWYNAMCKTFVNCNGPLIEKLEKASLSQEVINMETEFCSVSLDIIGKSVFNYDFGSVTTESPVIQAVYCALKEVSSSTHTYKGTHTYIHTHICTETHKIDIHAFLVVLSIYRSDKILYMSYPG